MSRFTDSVKNAWRRIRHLPPEHPPQKHFDRWENEGGAIGTSPHHDEDDGRRAQRPPGPPPDGEGGRDSRAL
jgi:hypothetical protein